MYSCLLTQNQTYSGSELRSHWIYEQTGHAGDAIVAFAGSCQVALTEMVDLEDVFAGLHIYSEAMLHIIIEHFETSLTAMVLRQRLLTAQIQQLLLDEGVAMVRRSGDDLFDGPAKLSVSIATVSPVSGLIHFGLNISSHNTPVLTRGLDDYGIDWQLFAQKLLDLYGAEHASMLKARAKVRAVV